MNRQPRIFQLIESELRKNLTFDFSMAENTSRPGSPSFGKGDTVEFRIWVRNDGDLRFSSVSGILSATVATEFEARRFTIRDLDPYQEREVARIRARILTDPKGSAGCGWIAKLAVVASAALDRIEVRESGRFLGYSSSGAVRDRRTGRPRSIPLSDSPHCLG